VVHFIVPQQMIIQQAIKKGLEIIKVKLKNLIITKIKLLLSVVITLVIVELKVNHNLHNHKINPSLIINPKIQVPPLKELKVVGNNLKHNKDQEVLLYKMIHLKNKLICKKISQIVLINNNYNKEIINLQLHK
jgi:hypothetical protein